MPLSVFSNASRSFSALLFVANGSLRSEIEQVRSCFFDLLLACSFLVTVGVVIEGIEHLLSMGKPFVDEESGIFNATPLIEWHKKLERLGWLLVIVGVLGEGIFEAATTSADNILQDFNNTLLAITTQQAGNAARSAKIAHDEADAVKVIADEARADAKDALVKARAAQHELANAEAESAKAQALATNALASSTDASNRASKAEASLGKAETEAKNAERSASDALVLAREARKDAASFESDLARLRKQAADRVLDEYQQERVAQRVETFLATPYELGSVDTAEGTGLLIEIDTALASAGWIYRPSEDKTFRFLMNLRTGKQIEYVHGRNGVHIGFAKTSKLEPAANALAAALNAVDIAAFAVPLPDNDPSPNNIHVMVGSKP